MIKKIYLDLDDMLLNTSAHLFNYHGVPNLFNDPSKCGKRDIHKHLNMTWNECWYELSQSFWESIPKMAWADNLIKLCEEYTPGEVYLLTSPIRNGACLAGKQLWTNKYLGKYASKLIIGHAKHAVVGTDGLLIDDSYENQEKFIEYNKGENFYLFPSYQNELWPIMDALLEEPDKVIRMIRNHLESIM